MLPGFRFLFAAIVLSMSVLVFGLGAAALLRTAHEQFASIPSRRAPPEPVFARASEPPMPTLALLRFEPPVPEKVPDNVAVTIASEHEMPTAAALEAVSAETEKLAALGPDQAAPVEPVKPTVPAAETAPVAQAAPAIAPVAASEEVKPAATDETKIAAIAEPQPAPMVTSTAVSNTPAPVPEAPSTESNIAATKIATLGGPAVIIEQPASVKKPSAKPDRSAARKRAARAKERRRIAARRAALLAQQAAAQQQANPFDPQAVTRAKR
jgi:hypothetical protein